MTLYFANMPDKTGNTARLMRLTDRNANTLHMDYSGNNLTSVLVQRPE